MVVEVVVLVVALVIALIRVNHSAGLFPVRLLATVWVDLFRGVPTVLLVYLIGTSGSFTGVTRALKKRNPSLRAYAHAGSNISREALLGALVERGELGASVNAFFEQHDILICPVYPCVAMPLDALPAGNVLFPHFTAWCNQLGLPAASVYGGMTDSGLPVGVQIVGGRHADALVLWASHLFEHAFGRAPLPELARGFYAAGHGRAPS